MKKLLLSLLVLSSLFTIAQQPFNHDIEGKCSRFEQLKQLKHNTPRDVTQVADTYNPHYMQIKMDVTSASTYIKGDVSTHAHVTSSQLDTIYMELNSALNLDSIKFNGNTISNYTFSNAEIFIILDTPLSEGDAFSTEVYYHGTPNSAGGFFSGLNHEHNYYYDKDVTWTLSEPFSARDWLAVRQSLTYKIDSVDQEYTCPDNNMVGSNGILEETVDNGNGTKTFKWKTRYPISYYLLSFSVSDYMEYNVYAKPVALEGDSILIQNFIYNDEDYLNYNQNKIEKSDELLELFSEKYGLYPFYQEKYGNCISEIGGGMEHQTMTTMGSFDFGLNAHEMGHQWFGDNITCAKWNDIWINEGFASYSSTIAKEFLVSIASAKAEMRSYQDDAMSSPGGSVYVPESEVYYGNEWRIFSGRLTYHKGAAILHQLRYLVNNDSIFFGFLNHYTDTFRGQTATGAQFRDAMETYTGLDLHPYFDQWYYGEGYPTYSINCEQGDSGNAKFTVTQTTSTGTTPFFDLPLEIKVIFANNGGDSTFRIPITANTTVYSVPDLLPISSIKIDPNDWILNEEGDITLGINDVHNNLDLVVGPNPAQNYLQVNFKQTNTPITIDIFDISGKLVLTQQLEHSGQHINIAHLPNAYYMIKATQGATTVSRKIVKI
ncbi:MAG: hypothetical protein CSB02_00260 [Bacteroidia bacterium]|nr:MAG: hypothetical protein CSB02_00260 [Bacteroidia bacterium]